MSLEELTDPEMELNETDVFVNELLSFNQFWDHLLVTYKPLEIALLAFGLIGNLLALITFASSKKMCTPSFVYHRLLVGADLLFCCNFFLNLMVDSWLGIACRQYIFKYWIGAFYSGSLYHGIVSSCGYMIDYSTLVIALDRFLALVSASNFQRWNRLSVASIISVFIVLLSCVFHSWPSFMIKTVITYHLGRSEDILIGDPCWNETVTYYWINEENSNEIFQGAVRAKEIYNRIIRMIYPILLSLLTLGVVVGIIRRQRRRDRATAGGGRGRRGSGCSVEGLEVGFRDRTVSADRFNGIRKRRRCERALFLMMTAVLVLAFVQVAASEARRLLGLFHPPDTILRTKVADSSLPLEERIWYFRFVLYGHQASKMLANLCTVISRSFICVLYMVMNRLFRRELFALFSICHRRNEPTIRHRFEPDPRRDNAGLRRDEAGRLLHVMEMQSAAVSRDAMGESVVRL